MIGSYGISSKQAYKLSFTLVGKTQTKHLPDQPDLVIYSLFTNFLPQQNSSIINVLPNIKSVRLNLNLTSTQNHYSCFCIPHVKLCQGKKSTQSTSFIITILYWTYR